MENNSPLVSVVIITYNSSRLVLETLESIKSQTYKNLELVVSDDCSNDDTVNVVKEWVRCNKQYFSNTKIVIGEKNKGISANCNNGVRAASGEWIKLLAGDDKLEPFAIEEYMNFIRMNQGAKFLCCKLRMFGDDEKFVKETESHYETDFYPKLQLSHEQQYDELLKMLFIPAPGVFYLKEIWEDVNGYEEKYKYCEEHPFYVKVIKKYKLYFVDKHLVLYRVYRGSVCRAKTKVPLVYEGTKQFFKDTLFSLLVKHGHLFFAIERYFQFKDLDFEYYDSNIVYKCFVKLLHLLSPYRVYSYLKKVQKGFG